MNQVNITGMIANEPFFREEAGSIPHVILNLRHRHKTRAGEVRKETYRVSAWHGVAVWAHDNIAVGQIVTVHGYLTQRKTREGAIATEICAEEIVPSVQTAFRLSQTIGNDVASVNSGDDPAQANQSVAADSAPATDATTATDAINSADTPKPEPGETPDPSDAPEMPALPSNSDAPAA